MVCSVALYSSIDGLSIWETVILQLWGIFLNYLLSDLLSSIFSIVPFWISCYSELDAS